MNEVANRGSQRGWVTDETEGELQSVDPGMSLEDRVRVHGLSAETLNGWLKDVQEQPTWRGQADIYCDYYDGNQYDAATLIEMRSKGIPPIVVNLIHPTINLVLGLEAKTRSDWVVKSDSEEDELPALALSKEMKVFERETQADNACSAAYSGQIKAGLGWVEVGINKFDPYGYRFRAEYVHRREIWWDWHDEDPGLEKARWLMRRKWYDLDVAKAMFPDHAEMIEYAYNDWAGFDPVGWDEAQMLYMEECQEHQRNFAWNRDEWCNPARRRVCLYEMWYRVIERGWVVRSRDGKSVFAFDPKKPNPLHIAAIESGAMQLEEAIIPKVRLSWWIGPHKVADIPSPYPHRWFPYVPFWGFREDRTGVPYGMIKMMKPLQDEVNARRAKMMQMLSTVRVMADDDAVLDWSKFQKEVARPDALIKMNSARKNRDASALQIQEHGGMSQQQFDVYMDSKQTLQDAGGVYQQQLGKEGAAESGIAISQLIEQGTTTLAAINQNFRFSRTRVGEIGLSLLQAEMAGKPRATVVEHKGVRKKVRFNVKKFDEEMQRDYLENDVTRLKMRMALADIPQTPTFRAQQLMQLTDLVKSLPEQIQGMVVDLVIKATDLPDKEELVSRIRGMMGINDTDPSMMNEQELAQYMQKQQQAAELEAANKRILELEAEVQRATAGQKDADAALKKAQTAKTYIESGLDPGSMMSGVPTDDPYMRAIDDAMSDADADVPGADPAKLAMARGDSPAQRTAGAPPMQKPGGPPGGPGKTARPAITEGA